MLALNAKWALIYQPTRRTHVYYVDAKLPPDHPQWYLGGDRLIKAHHIAYHRGFVKEYLQNPYELTKRGQALMKLTS
jgi:hypothetical protein